MSCWPPLTGLATTLRRTKVHWGCTIYRTTYTPLSEAHFARIIDLLGFLIKDNVRSQHDETDDEERDAYHTLIEYYQPIIMNDKAKFDGMAIDDVRSHYETYLAIPDPDGYVQTKVVDPDEWMERDSPERTEISETTETRPWTHSNFCIIIDEEVVQNLADADSATLLATDHKGRFLRANILKYWVKVVDVYVEDSENGEVEDEGWMKCSIYKLWNFWRDMCGEAGVSTWSAVNEGPYHG